MTARPHARSVQGGMTLVEILVSTLIAILISSVALGLYAAVTSTLRRQAEWRRSWGAADNAIELLRHDLAGALAPATTTQPSFALLPGDDNPTSMSSLSFYSVKVPPGQTPLRPFQLWHIRYEVCRPPETPESPAVLLRAAQSVDGAVGNPPSSPEELLRGIRTLEWQVYDGKNWTNRWDGRLSETLPQGLRVQIELDSTGPTNRLATELLIPAGITLVPRTPSESPPAGLAPAGSRTATTQTGVPPDPEHSP